MCPCFLRFREIKNMPEFSMTKQTFEEKRQATLSSIFELLWWAETVKNLPAMWETWVRSLGWEDPLKEGMATQSSILAWKISWTEEPGGLQSMGLQKVRHDWVTKHSTAQEDIWTLGRSDFRARWVFMTFLGMPGGGDTCHFRCHFLSFILDELKISETGTVNYF